MSWVIASLTSDSNVVIPVSLSKWLIIIQSCTHEVHVVISRLEIVLIVFITVILVVSFITHISLSILLISIVVLIPFLLFFINVVGYLSVLQLEDLKSINIKDLSDFNIHLLLNLYLFSLREGFYGLVVNDG